MSILLVAVAVYTIVGGMLSVLITDYLQFVVMSAGLLAVALLTLYQVPWSTLVDTVQENYGDGGFNPLVNKDLGWSWVIFNGMLNAAAVLRTQFIVTLQILECGTYTSRVRSTVYAGNAEVIDPSRKLAATNALQAW